MAVALARCSQPRTAAPTPERATLSSRRARATKSVLQAMAQPQVSQRVLETDAPIIVKIKAMLAKRPDALSLAQGIVHWQPPPEALQEAARVLSSDPSVSGYGPAEGMPALREALRAKVARVNKLTNVNVMVTAGANQAFTNIVLTLCDAQDPVVFFKPVYFNHLMAVQMSGGKAQVVLGPFHPDTVHPDLDWLEQQLKGERKPKMVVLTNPCNPTGVMLSEQEVQRAAQLCAQAGAWLVLDNTYEDFVFEGRTHTCACGPHVINVFSMSKAYGMMGWRVGYMAYHDDGKDSLGKELLKIQDTIPICASQLSQHMALEALKHHEYVARNIDALAETRTMVLDALSPLGTQGNGIAGGEGAIYLWAKLPDGCEDDEAVVAWLVAEHGVAVIPGSAFGTPGYIRTAFANLKPDVCRRAASRLKAGLTQLVKHGMTTAPAAVVNVAAGAAAS